MKLATFSHRGMRLTEHSRELAVVAGTDVDYVDISPRQTVGLSASLIPFLEPDDANNTDGSE